MPGGRTYSKLNIDKVKNAINEAHGNLTTAARMCGVARQQFYNFIKTHSDAQAELKQARESMIDNAESALYSAILNREAWAICFFLKTQAKHRGYVERTEYTGADGGPVGIKLFDFDASAYPKKDKKS